MQTNPTIIETWRARFPSDQIYSKMVALFQKLLSPLDKRDFIFMKITFSLKDTVFTQPQMGIRSQ